MRIHTDTRTISLFYTFRIEIAKCLISLSTDTIFAFRNSGINLYLVGPNERRNRFLKVSGILMIEARLILNFRKERWINFVKRKALNKKNGD